MHNFTAKEIKTICSTTNQHCYRDGTGCRVEVFSDGVVRVVEASNNINPEAILRFSKPTTMSEIKKWLGCVVG